ncbi:hypothetical protein GCM10022209_17690 [Chitinophaga oryziterrae]
MNMYKILRKEIIRWWEGRRFLYNLVVIVGMIVCLVIMKQLNSASVNFFMLPFLILYVLGLNIIYTIYLFSIKSNKENVYRWLIAVTLLMHVVLAISLVLKVPHR